MSQPRRSREKVGEEDVDLAIQQFFPTRTSKMYPVEKRYLSVQSFLPCKYLASFFLHLFFFQNL
jgi:hypothetical protein